MNITVGGVGYVGLSVAVLLSQQNDVTAVDIVPEKIDLINSWKSPIADEYIEKFMVEHEKRGLHLIATTDGDLAYADADYIIVAANTEYDANLHQLNTKAVESIISQALRVNDHAPIIIKSTIPVDFTERMNVEHKTDRIMFFPEFLRETKALYDNLYPSRIIGGAREAVREQAEVFANLLAKAAIKANVPILIMNPTEAETVKLFANTYLAMRVAYFNELDTFAIGQGLNTKKIIEGVCLDPRIGDFYNAPSFSYGGLCLVKDSRSLLASYGNTPQKLIQAVVESNRTRKDFIAKQVLEKAERLLLDDEHNPAESDEGNGSRNVREVVIGVYRLITKTGADNVRHNPTEGIIKRLQERGAMVIIYEPMMPQHSKYDGSLVENQMDVFKAQCDVIIANRYDSCLDDVREKVYTRDLFGRD